MLGKNVSQRSKEERGANNSCILEAASLSDLKRRIQMRYEGTMNPGNAGYLPCLK
jgi:hypothetical protein